MSLTGTGPRVSRLAAPIAVGPDGQAHPVESPVAASVLRPLQLTADVVSIVPDGTAYGRFGFGSTGDMTLREATTKTFCAKPGGCQCPPGQRTHLKFTPIPAGPAFLAVTGGLGHGRVTVTGYSLPNVCQPGPTRSGPPPHACDILTPTEVRDLVGRNIGDPIRSANPPETRCTYPPPDLTDPFNMSLSVTSGADEATFAQAADVMAGIGTVTPVNDVGDEAFQVSWTGQSQLATSGQLTVTAVVARTGEIIVQATLGNDGGPLLTEATALAQAMVNHLWPCSITC